MQKIKRFFHAHPNAIAFLILFILVGYLFSSLQVNINKIYKVDNRTKKFAPITHKTIGISDIVEGVSGISIHRGNPIHLDIDLCNKLNRLVKGSSSLSWQAVGPNGHPLVAQAITSYAGAYGERQPGCHEKLLTLNMPSGVLDIDDSLTTLHIPHKWRLFGGFIPLKPDGSFGSKDIFTSPVFTIVP